MAKISIRELRHHAGQYLTRVEHGEVFELTDHGRVVAMVVPAVHDEWQQMLASGRLLPQTVPGMALHDPPVDYWPSEPASNRLADARGSAC